MSEKKPVHRWFERLDPSKCMVFLYSKNATTNCITCYRVRSAKEAHKFFTVGRVFAMLWTDTSTMRSSSSTRATTGRSNEDVFSQIRRFVVVDVNRERHFVYAWSDYDQCFSDCKLT
jgi:hypothetical protein